MRTPFVAGNWKMNKKLRKHADWLPKWRPSCARSRAWRRCSARPLCALCRSRRSCRHRYWPGAQNIHWEPKGAYTGEVAAEMVAEFCKYVIIGHSERRTYFGERTRRLIRRLLPQKLQAWSRSFVSAKRWPSTNQAGRRSGFPPDPRWT